MTVAIYPRSRLQFSNLSLVNGEEFWDIPKIPKMSAQTDDTVYQWDQLDRIENVAETFYGDERLWWIIARRNNIFDMPTAIATGERIIIPSRRYVFDVLFKKR